MPRRKLRLGKHYAAVTLDRKIGQLRVWEFVHPPGCVIPEHRHERAHAIVILAGGFAEHKKDGSTSEHRCGDAILYPRGAVHANTVGEAGAVSLGIEFEADYLPQLVPGELPRLGRSVALARSAKRYADRVMRAARSQDPDAAEDVERAVRALVLRIVRERPPEPAWIGKVKAALDAALHLEPDIAKLAREVGRHPAHLMREFRRYVGVPVGEYARALRIARACDDLRRPDIRLSDIAAAHDFADQSHFARTFQRFMNMTPDAYRKARLMERD